MTWTLPPLTTPPIPRSSLQPHPAPLPLAPRQPQLLPAASNQDEHGAPAIDVPPPSSLRQVAAQEEALSSGRELVVAQPLRLALPSGVRGKRRGGHRARVLFEGAYGAAWGRSIPVGLLEWGEALAQDAQERAKWTQEQGRMEQLVGEFIYRMHVVQGDRRFSHWKGSVLDSVVGVFLTQNVSDHLSSSQGSTQTGSLDEARGPVPAPSSAASATAGAVLGLRGEAAGTGMRDRKGDKRTQVDGSGEGEEGQVEDKKETRDGIPMVGLPDRVAGLLKSFELSQEEVQGMEAHSGKAPPKGEGLEMQGVLLQEEEQQQEGGVLFGEVEATECARAAMAACSHLHAAADIAGEGPSSMASGGEERMNEGDMWQLMSRDRVEELGPGTCREEDPCHVADGGEKLSAANGAGADSSWEASAVATSGGLQAAHLASRFLAAGPAPAANQSHVSPQPALAITAVESLPLPAASLGSCPPRERQLAAALAIKGMPGGTREKRTPASPTGQPAAMDGESEQAKELEGGLGGGLQLEREGLLPPPQEAGEGEGEEQGQGPAGAKKGATAAAAGACAPEEPPARAATGPGRAHWEAREGSHRAKKEKQRRDWEGVRRAALAREAREWGVGSSSTAEGNSSHGGGGDGASWARWKGDRWRDAVDWEAVGRAAVEEVADVIKERGMHYLLAGRIKALLKRLKEEHGELDLEWLRLLPVKDAQYPVQNSIQQYLWPRLCHLDQPTLYELHYQMITFGKVFCTKRAPNCPACPMRDQCQHFASAVAKARPALQGSSEEERHRRAQSVQPEAQLRLPLTSLPTEGPSEAPAVRMEAA
eukprot:jgi/Mesen1/9816/ME000007S09879